MRRVLSTVISRRQSGTTTSASAPHATTEAVGPAASSYRAIIPSIMLAAPSSTPDFMLSTVLVPMTGTGPSRLMWGSCAARLLSASSDTFTPGMIEPPIKVRERSTTEIFVAVPRSTMMAGSG